MKNVQSNAKLVTVSCYNKKDEKGEKTKEIGFYNLSLLIDEEKDKAMSGQVITTFVAKDFTTNLDPNSLPQRLQPCQVIVDTPEGNFKSYTIHNLTVIK